MTHFFRQAQDALNRAVDPERKTAKVHFHQRVTKAWVGQRVLAFVLICQNSYFGVVELLREFLGNRIFLGCPSDANPPFRFGNNLATTRAMSALCGHNVPGRRAVT